MSPHRDPEPPDAWQDFDPITSSADPGYLDMLDGFRDRCPVGWSAEHGGFWVVSTADEIIGVGQDWQRFTSVHGPGFPSMKIPQIMPAAYDPPEQRQFRQIVNPRLTPKAVSRLEPGIREAARTLIDTFADSGGCDLAATFNRAYPPLVFFTVVLRIDAAEIDAVRDMSHRFSYEPEAEDRAAGYHEMAAWCDEYLRRRDQEPRRDDLVDTLLHDVPDGMPFGHDDQVRALVLLIQGGFGTSANLLGTVTRVLCERPDIQDRVRADPELVTGLVEECLRFESPSPYMARRATCDTQIGGREIAEGEAVVLMYGAANRDPAHFENPTEVDLERASNHHYGFGVGVHRCIGSNLARLQVRVAIQELLAAITDLRLAPDATIEYFGTQARGIGHLPVTYRSRARATT